MLDLHGKIVCVKKGKDSMYIVNSSLKIRHA